MVISISCVQEVFLSDLQSKDMQFIVTTQKQAANPHN